MCSQHVPAFIVDALGDVKRLVTCVWFGSVRPYLVSFTFKLT